MVPSGAVLVTPGERRDFLVEVTPAKATFFTGDDIEITALSAAGMSIWAKLRL